MRSTPFSKLLHYSVLILLLIIGNGISHAQILHDNSCSSISTSFSLDWDTSPSATQFDWTPQGNTSFTASNIQGSGNQIAFTVTGATGTLTTENSVSTPAVTNSLSGGADALHISSSGLDATEEITLTMTFTPALAGDISFDLYNIIELSGGGAGGQQMEIFGLTSTGFAIVPQLTDDGSPSWELEGPGVIDGNATSTTSTNDQVGVNFRSIADISTITIILRRCSGCANAADTEFALGDIDICLTPDTDQDGIADTQDEDDDNDGILDVIEKCPTEDRDTADWDNFTYTNGDPSNTYALPDGTNMTVAVASNGASIVAGETSSFLTGGQGAGTVGLFLNGNQNLQVNSIDVTFSWDQAIDSLEYTIFDVDQFGGQYVDSITIIGFFDGFVVFPTMTASANNTVSQNRAVGDVSTADDLATANVDIAFSEPIDSMVIYYGNGSNAPAAPGNQWITIWDFSYIGDCGSVDSDGDGVADYLDIDADNDGIVDYIEWQVSSASPIAPAGADADSDGIDDNFESATAPIDTDGDGIPDFQDPDSDNDGDLDILEAYDTDNDGVADTSPAGTDTDGDGLDDNFDNQSGFNSTTNITNNGQDSEDFPDLDGGTGEQDWREDTDIDNDGIQDYDDIDDDNDGILDINEGKGSNNPSGDEDGDGIQNWADATDNGNGGDGSTTDYTDGNGDGIPDVYDADNDGIPNHHDPDSDNDGIADIVEAGGVDSDGNGIVDGAFTDTDGDGWSNTFDSDNGGTALTDVDQDGDGLQNHLDIDADDDGIVDVIESQASTASPTVPSGTDTDGDGIDDNFDTDSGNSLTTPVNTESFDNPDYLDLNSDNDLDSDQLEGYDTDNDGTANTLPAGADADNDGLDDNFDNVSGQNSTTNVTNSGQTSNSFPNLDVPGTSELDWRETGNIDDNDGDGVQDSDDIDDDNDGILDIDEAGACSQVANTTAAGIASYTATADGYLDITINGGDGGGGSTFAGGSGATISNAIYEIANAEVVRYVVGGGSTGSGSVSAGGAGSTGLFIENDLIMVAGGGGGGDNSLSGRGASSTTTGVSGTGTGAGAGGVGGAGAGISSGRAGGGGGINSAGGAGAAGGGSAADLVPGDGVTLVSGGAGSGSSTAGASGFTGGGGAADGDWGGGGGGYSGGGGGGDSGGAGAGGSFLNTSITSYRSGGTITAGTNGGGGASGVTGTDGFVTIEFCPIPDTDNDGIIDSFDPDSDGDGIADIIEAGGVDADGNGVVDGTFTDTDGDGWSNTFDSDNGGTALTDADTDADGFENRIDIDSDDDGIIDIVESQASGTLIAPSGTDSDGDGIDDNFDTDNGNTLTAPVNTDGTDNPDYTDTDSDNDGDLDALEGYDTDNDGTANTTPAGTDSDNDGLDDNYDSVVGPNSTTNVTNGGQTSSSFTDLDRPATPERDWREDKDYDGDGIIDADDIDDDNDGVLDVDECNGGGTIGQVASTTSAGIGSYTVPVDGQVTISMNGGDGGGGSNNAGGSGATITGAVFNVSASDVIRYVVGEGSAGSATSSSGGGGSSGLFIGDRLMMVTGGGGGGDNSTSAVGLGANTGTAGDDGTGTEIGSGGTAGSGGTVNAANVGGGGGGINGAGTGAGGAGGGSAADLVPGDGVTLVSGGAGSSAPDGGDGFTGGGGGGNGSWSGGGGGYSGGGAAGDNGSAGGGGSYINDTTATYVSGTITAGADGGGGATAGNGADGFVTISFSGTCTVDTDNDGITDNFDPDSDNDGIADIIEAGGVDSDGNGIVDGVFTDTDNDGWSDTFDSDNGGTALTDADTDGDGFENRIDIDSDDDGIVDVIESQATGTLTFAAGTDTDGDGIDDNFDTDSGNTLTTPVNTDGTDNPDYTDTDSDNDYDLDALEGWDTDNDGTADTSPAGTDTDNDGLDDNYDDIVGPNATTNVTNGGQSSSSFPNLDDGGTIERDWRETQDKDGDGIVDSEDKDDDNDGIRDSEENRVIKFDFATAGDGAGGSVADWNSVNGNSTITAGNVILHNSGSVISGVSVAFTNFSGGTRFVDNASADGWGGTTNDRYYELAHDDIYNHNNASQGVITISGLPTDVNFNVRIYSLLDSDVTIDTWTVSNGSVDRTVTNGRDVRWAASTLSAAGTVFNNVSLNGSNNMVITLPNVSFLPLNAIVIEILDDDDQDGIPNSCDLDSDGDGIADIIEAGGTDANGDGVVDTSTDTDGDGWADTFDSDNGGTALSDPDTDGDGIPDREDIDSDDDGIVDIIESQATGTLTGPSGLDTDGDGIDDNFDPTQGNSLTTPVNTDGTDNPDYTDTDSDNDLVSDAIEGYDTDNDGAANTTAAGTDTDGDGLDDNYDNEVGPNRTTNITNNGQSSSSFPNLDNTSTSERDWRELEDKDGDGVGNIADADDDNDGIVDSEECGGSEISESGFDGVTGLSFGNNIGASISPWTFTGTNTNVINVDGPGGSTYGTGGPEHDARGGAGNYYDVASSAGDLYQTFVLSSTTTVYYDGYFSARDGLTGNGDITIRAGTGTAGAIQSTTGTITTSDNTAWTYASNFVTLPAGTYSYVVTLDNPCNFDEAGLSFTCDTDGDGIINRCDLDSDNDGIADIIEAGGTDSNNDGVVDTATDTDGDGLANTFDGDDSGTPLTDADTDSDGNEDRIDIDADNDGLIDNREAQTTLAFLAPLGTDTDGDGWDDRYDSDNGGTAITLSNNEGAGNPDYTDDDSDGDGSPDYIEGFDDDEDSDALNDLTTRATTYEAAAGNPLHYVNSDDADMDGIPDWLEDDDMDGVVNFLDPDDGLYVDTDGDGLVNLYDTDNNGAASILPDTDGDGEWDFRDTDGPVGGLPITLIDFVAVKSGELVQLNWATETEINNDYFTIERSADGLLFEPLLTESGAGNSTSRRDYIRFDEAPMKGYNYYRLRQTDFDGNTESFNVELVYFEGERTEYILYPNPTEGSNLFMEILKPELGRTKIEIRAQDGRLITERNININEELSNYKFELLNGMELASGVYNIRILTEKDSKVLPFIVK